MIRVFSVGREIRVCSPRRFWTSVSGTQEENLFVADHADKQVSISRLR